jgi:DNA-binding SARP family transcriptional activator/tetratricopeptide (TPR) repeat protein
VARRRPAAARRGRLRLPAYRYWAVAPIVLRVSSLPPAAGDGAVRPAGELVDVRVRLLGPVDVLAGGASRPVRGARRVAVLAALALRPGEVVSVEQLIDAVWGDAAPAGAAATVQSHVSYLRRLLGDRGSVVGRRPGYLLELAGGLTDVGAAERLIEAAAGAPDPARATDWLQAAVDLWRARPLPELAGLAWFDVHVRRLEELLVRAREMLVGSRLALGQHAQLIPELETLTLEHPLHEGFWAHLMLALYRAGRQADALAAYQRVSTILRDELGVDSGRPLRELHAAILRQDTSLSSAAPPAPAPVIEVAVRSRGPAQLPRAVAAFSGRQAELAALDQLLPTGDGPPPQGICVLSGPPGVGKTTLTVHWAHRVAGGFPDGQLYVNLRGYDPGGTAMEPAEAVHGFLDALGVPASRVPTSPDGQAALYRSTLAGRRVLVVIDNARDAEQVRPLLPGTPAAVVLVTSRGHLAPLVATDGAHPVTLGVLSAAEAEWLLVRRLGEARVAAEPEAAAGIVESCARLPLALSIVAARAAVYPSLPLRDLAAELAQARGRLDALTAGDQASDVRAVFSWSYRALSPAAARLFRLLGPQPVPDLPVPAAASLAGLPVAQTRPLLAELTGAGLVAEPTPGRYALHDLLRVYAADLAAQLDADGQRRAAVRRLLDYYTHTAIAAERVLNPHRNPPRLPPEAPVAGVVPDQPVEVPAATDWFAAQRPALLAVQRLAAETGHDTYAWQLAWSLDTYLQRNSHWYDLLAAWRVGLAAGERLGNAGAVATAHLHLGLACSRLGRGADAERHLGLALDLYAAAGDLLGQARVHLNLSLRRERDGQYERALEHDQQALALSTAAGHRRTMGQALNSLGWGHARIGDYPRALAYCREALAIFEESGYRAGQAMTWDTLGYAHSEHGQYAEAADACGHAIEIFNEIGDRYNHAESLTRLGGIHQATGELPAAREAWRQAYTILAHLDHPRAAGAAAHLADLLDAAPTGR